MSVRLERMIFATVMMLIAVLAVLLLVPGCAGLDTQAALGTRDHFTRSADGAVDLSNVGTQDQIIEMAKGVLKFDENGKLDKQASQIAEYFYRESSPSPDAAMAYVESVKAQFEFGKEIVGLIRDALPVIQSYMMARSPPATTQPASSDGGRWDTLISAVLERLPPPGGTVP